MSTTARRAPGTRYRNVGISPECECGEFPRISGVSHQFQERLRRSCYTLARASWERVFFIAFTLSRGKLPFTLRLNEKAPFLTLSGVPISKPARLKSIVAGAHVGLEPKVTERK